MSILDVIVNTFTELERHGLFAIPNESRAIFHMVCEASEALDAWMRERPEANGEVRAHSRNNDVRYEIAQTIIMGVLALKAGGSDPEDVILNTLRKMAEERNSRV